VRLSRAGLRDPKKPRGVFLFVGVSGVGKTELARALSDFLFPEGNALIKIDMSEFNEKHTVSRLIGAPPGYTGHGEEGQLSGPLRRRPYSVVLLDEFEKAHADVQSLFLGLFDEGVLTDAQQRRIEAREAFFIVTTNAGSDLSSKPRVGFSPGADRVRDDVLDRVRPYFRPELINRIDEVVVFKPLDPEALRAIADLHLARLAARAEPEGILLEWEAAVADHCAVQAKDARFGARPILRAIDDLVAQPLGQLLLARDDQSPRRLRACMRDGGVVFEEELTVQGRREPVPG
jgi:ATP-dependent Clp protease ATP-binding subunit ClpA